MNNQERLRQINLPRPLDALDEMSIRRCPEFARKLDFHFAKLREIEEALSIVGRIVDPVIGPQAIQGRWNPVEQR